MPLARILLNWLLFMATLHLTQCAEQKVWTEREKLPGAEMNKAINETMLQTELVPWEE